MSRITVITGASGGMGRACARVFGATGPLVLTDVAAGPLALFAEELRGEGYRIAGVQGGDLGSEAVLAGIAGDLAEAGAFTVVHAAGLSPSQADWQTIMAVNLVATERLLQAVEPLLQPGCVGILIASTAGHMMPAIPDAQAVLDEPLAGDLLERIGPVIEAMAPHAGPAGARGLSYSFSKQAVIRMAEQRAASWGAKGARIVSISPGLILTPMGRREVAETPGARETRDAAPAGRAGTAMDIAQAAFFLASDAASFITGSDVKVDGGTVAAMRHMAG